jgi:hypothetical protein
MAYAKPGPPYLQVSAALTQYLNTAAGGHVFVEQSIALNRWRLCCEKCSQTLTFGEGEDVATKYQHFAELDSSIQAFVNEHRHTPVKKNPNPGGWSGAVDPLSIDPLTGQHKPGYSYKITYGVSKKYANPNPAVTETKIEVKMPRKTTGRKFRPV